jgi:hypothetical protein
MTSNGKIDIYAEDSISIHTENDLNIRADRDINMEAGRNINLKSVNRTQIESGGEMNLVIGANGNITTTGNLNVATGIANYFTAGGNTNILSGGTHFETAGTIHMNGPSATPATPASALSTHENILTSSKEKWGDKNRYAVSAPLNSIMKRVPMHEPWALHENFAPQFLTPSNTDREA